MHFQKLPTCALAALSCLSLPTMALPTTDHSPVENMVPRQVTAPDGTLSTVYINRNLAFVSGPEDTATTRPSRRTVTFTSGGRDDYCGETNPDESFGSDAPLASDCLSIAHYMETVDGYYTVQASDFNHDGWAIVATSGTCSFAIQYQLSGDIQQTVIGTNDIHFYINGYARDAQNGRIKAVGTMACYNDPKLVFLLWGMIHS